MTAVAVYVSPPMYIVIRWSRVSAIGEPLKSEPIVRGTGLRALEGAGNPTLLPVCLVASRKCPRVSAVSLTAKRGGGKRLLTLAPALIAGEILSDLDVFINLGGAGSF